MYQTLKGTVRQGRIEITENVTLPENATVLVTILETPPAPVKRDWQAELDKIHARLRASGHKPPTPQEVAEYIAGERNSWND
ncbi:MAG TPA: hypothetical protein VI793_05380 [Anaerolineales bacterium]|nr:hypothetical protein [Anaerolineales bacterium]